VEPSGGMTVKDARVDCQGGFPYWELHRSPRMWLALG
jgi:hypothetical protein